ncbi:hypothetical protein GLOIN_2v1733770 [Rhizophagus irregularis DAOM 181602=DAOM 197198]|nr:hypothetical protein GLOIN_2v1733770 [Rhizophagus irregularis DAOM 181602=DAOM 197198]
MTRYIILIKPNLSLINITYYKILERIGIGGCWNNVEPESIKPRDKVALYSLKLKEVIQGLQRLYQPDDKCELTDIEISAMGFYKLAQNHRVQKRKKLPRNIALKRLNIASAYMSPICKQGFEKYIKIINDTQLFYITL